MFCRRAIFISMRINAIVDCYIKYKNRISLLYTLIMRITSLFVTDSLFFGIYPLNVALQLKTILFHFCYSKIIIHSKASSGADICLLFE